MFEIVATENDKGRTLIKIIQKYLSKLHSSTIEKLFRNKNIKINGKRTKDKQLIVELGDKIVVYGIKETKPQLKQVKKIAFNFNVLFEDENLLVVDKPINIAIHDGEDSLDKQVISYLNFVANDSFIPSHIGRLDKETSGIILYGKNYETVKQLNDKHNQFIKVYQFQSDYNLGPKEIDLYFYKDIKNKVKVSIKEIENSKLGKTYFYIENNKKFARILTGRKHQIRATLRYLGFPIYGDTRYGGKKSKRLMLHSYYIKINKLNGKLEYLNGYEFYSQPKW